MLDLFDYWIELPSSVTNDVKRNWAFALWRAKHTGASYLHELLRSRNHVVSYDIEDESLLDLLGSVSEPEVLDPDEERREKIREMFSEMDEEDLQRFLLPVLRGESTRQQGRRENTNHVAIHRFRVHAKQRLFAKAVNVGIY